MSDIFGRDPLEDLRQSPRALMVQRGVRRMLRAEGWSSIPEVTLKTGRRADIMAISPSGQIMIVEIKSSVADLRADAKWHEYREFCDLIYFAAPPDLSIDIFPEDAGFIAADDYGAAILREARATAMQQVMASGAYAPLGELLAAPFRATVISQLP